MLNVGLVVFGVGIALMARADLGLGPWAVLHDGVGKRVGQPLGTIDVVLGLAILAAWIPLRERPGPGTVLSAVVIGIATNVGLGLISSPEDLGWRVADLAAGALLVGIGSGLYLGVAMGPGPRDGLMTGLHRRLGRPLWVVRMLIELSALVAGFLLGGAVGPGTVVYAFVIGPLVAVFLPRFSQRYNTTVRAPGPGAPTLPREIA